MWMYIDDISLENKTIINNLLTPETGQEKYLTTFKFYHSSDHMAAESLAHGAKIGD